MRNQFSCERRNFIGLMQIEEIFPTANCFIQPETTRIEIGKEDLS